MKKLILFAALSTCVALTACDGGSTPYQGDDGSAQAPAAAAPDDHMLRDGLIGGALGYVAGRASQPRAAVQNVHYVTHVYRPSYNRPAYVAPYRRSYRPSYSAPSVVRTTTTTTRSYRR